MTTLPALPPCPKPGCKTPITHWHDNDGYVYACDFVLNDEPCPHNYPDNRCHAPAASKPGPQCACTTNRDGSVTTFLCPVHAEVDPCYTRSRVTGKRRTGTIRRGVCTNCGHISK